MREKSVTIESLEMRRLLSATVRVECYRDADFSASYTAGDEPIANRVVRLSYSDSGMPSFEATTDANGVATFADIPAGTVRISEVYPDGWAGAPGGTESFSVADGKTATTRRTSNDRGAIAGIVYGDDDRNGYHTAGDRSALGRTVFVDLDADGVLDDGEPSQLTTASGFRFEFTTPGTYTIRTDLPPGHRVMGQFTAVSGTVTVAIGRERWVEFGTTDLPVPGRIGSRAFVDANANGVFDAGERALNRLPTQVLDLATGQTHSTAYSNGSTVFPLQPGTYRLTATVPSGVTLTTPNPAEITLAAGETRIVDFGFHTTDTTPPQVVSARFDGQSANGKLVFQFDEYAFDRFAITDVAVSRLAPNPIPYAVNGSYFWPGEVDYVTNTFTLTFPMSSLINGTYRVTVKAGRFENLVGQPLAADHTFDFHVLRGDANGDAVVDFDDMLIVARNYGQTGRSFSDGNFDFSTNGSVDFNDLLTLARHYGHTPATPPPTVPPRAAPDAEATPVTRRRATAALLVE